MVLQFEKADMNRDKIKSLVLAGDAGATKTNLALFKCESDKITSLKETKYHSNDYRNLTAMLGEFLKDADQPDVICMGIAGPVVNGQAKLSNIKWNIDSAEISSQSGIKKVFLINDLEATAYGLAMLTEKDIQTIHVPTENVNGNAAIIAPGTGLGEAGLYWDGKAFHPFATEGGHCDFAPRDELDVELYRFLQNEFGHVSGERLLCGPGILNIYRFLRDVKKYEEPVWLKEKLKDADDPSVISRHTHDSLICRETMRLFIRYLGFESANLVLKFKATGGLFIGGGIAPQITSLFEDSLFYSSFCQSGRLNSLLEKVPIKIILNSKTALLGAAYFGSIN